MKRRIGIITAALLLTSTPALARPVLTQSAADQRARAALQDYVITTNEDIGSIPLGNPGQDYSTITSYTVDSCDLGGAHHALCDYTLTWSDQTVCNDTLSLIQGKNRIFVRSLSDWAWDGSNCA